MLLHTAVLKQKIPGTPEYEYPQELNKEIDEYMRNRTADQPRRQRRRPEWHFADDFPKLRDIHRSARGGLDWFLY